MLMPGLQSYPPPPGSGSAGISSASPFLGGGGGGVGTLGAEAGAGGGNHSNPQTAINGFIAMILTVVCFLLYLVWLVVPQSMLHQLHISYYPDKYWALAIPALLTMLYAYYLFVSVCLALMTTHPLEDARCVADVDSREDTEVNCGALTQSAGSVAPWADIAVPVASALLFSTLDGAAMNEEEDYW